METKKTNYFPFLKKYFYPFTPVVAFLAALYSLCDPIINAFKSGNDLMGIIYISFCIFIVFLGYLLRPKQPPPLPLKKEVFQGVGKLSANEAWPRTDEKNMLCKTIKKTVGKPIILVGSSGVGKSVLLNTQVVPELEDEGWESIFFLSYNTFQSFQSNLKEKILKIFPNFYANNFMKLGVLDGIDNNKNILFIFDQFEQFLSANSKNDSESKKNREWFRSFLESSIKFSRIRHLIVVRKEWYYDLRFLAEFVPPPYLSFHLSGIKTEENEDTKVILETKIRNVTNNPIVVEVILNNLIEDNEILPLEAQIVGLMLENKVKEMGYINAENYFKEFGHKEGLIQSYFRTYLDSSPDSAISLQVLFALSIETRLRTQLPLPQIADVVHKSMSDVYKCLSFFVQNDLVLDTGDGNFELAHDYLAEKFHDLSGAELDPVERDNILFFWDEIHKSKIHLKIARPKEKAKKGMIFSDYFITFIGILLIARLFGPAYGVDWGWINLLAKYQIIKTGIDVYFLPIFVSNLAWAIYAALFYRNLFANIKENPSAKILSKFTLINCTIFIIVDVFLPYFWLLSIGWGGIVIGIKIYQLSKSSGMGKTSSGFFKLIAITTIINLIIISGIGVLTIHYLHSTTLSVAFVEKVNIVFILLSMFLTYFMLAVTPKHVTKKATSKMLGLIDRGSVRLQRMNFELNQGLKRVK